MPDASAHEPATFRNGRLRLSDGVLHHAGRGFNRRTAFEIRLSSVTAVGVTRWFTAYVLVLLTPVFVFVPALFVGMVTQDVRASIDTLLLDLVLLPFLLTLAWRMLPPYAIRIVGGGATIHVPVGRRRLDEAVAFVRRTSAATMQPSHDDHRTGYPKTPKAVRE